MLFTCDRLNQSTSAPESFGIHSAFNSRSVAHRSGRLSKGATMEKKTLIGFEFGLCKVVDFAGRDKYRSALWKCACKCGTIWNVSQSVIIGAKIKSCGCAKHATGGSKSPYKCSNCGIEMILWPSRVNRSKRIYCSTKCANEASKNTILNVECKHCGLAFHARTHALVRTKFCSKKCQADWERGREKRPAIEYFFNHIEKTTEGCWFWNGKKNNKGYGLLYANGKNNVLAHRFSYEYHKGKIGDGLLCCHHCDNPPCVNPDHLFEGTYSENMQDCVRKGRHHETKARLIREGMLL